MRGGASAGIGEHGGRRGGLIDRRLVAISGNRRPVLALIVGLRLLVTATLVAQALLLARMILDATTGGRLLLPIVAIALLAALRAGLLWWEARLETRAGAEVEATVRRALVRKVIDLGPAFTISERTGELETALLEGASSGASYVAGFLPLLLSSLLAFTILVIVIFALDPFVGAIVLASALLVPLAPVVSERAFGEAGRRFWMNFAGLAAEYLDALQGMTTLKVFQAQDRWGERLRDRSEDLTRDAVSLTGLASMYVGFVALGVAAGTGFGAAKAAFQLAGGGISILTALSLLFLARELFRPLVELHSAVHPAAFAVAAGGRILELLATEARVRAIDPPSEPSPRPPASVQFDGVWFAYRMDGRPALDGASFRVDEGETVAVVGRSGAGKTTLVSLLLRFYEPERGRVMIGGRDLRDLAPGDVRAMVAVVPQETYLFHRSVRENLRLGDPSADDGRIEAAARAAHAHGFIAQLPQGYDTVVGERGVRLSGGERQRIAIARALLKDAPILVLDEATSSVDAESESLIQEAIGRLASSRTSLVIAHRLSTVRGADRIVVLDRGRVVEVGAPCDLVERDGPYARLMAAQESV